MFLATVGRGRLTTAYIGLCRSRARALNVLLSALTGVTTGPEYPYLLMLLLFCLEPNKPCMMMIGVCFDVDSTPGGSYRLYARLR